ncbi:MAG: PadR family transcriptional regulator [Actinomycetes bacterium]
MKSRRRVSNPLALAALGCLIERPMHPYEISTTLRSRGKEDSIKLNYGSLYSVVGSLLKYGLIAPQETLRDSRRPERTVYTITEAGRAEFEDWLAELLSQPVKEFTSLEAGLSLMLGLPPDEVARLLGERADRLQIELRKIDAMHDVATERGLPSIFLIESGFRRAMLAAELDFVTQLTSDIRSGNLSGTHLWSRIHELLAEGLSFEQIFADPVGHLGEEARVLAAPDAES